MTYDTEARARQLAVTLVAEHIGCRPSDCETIIDHEGIAAIAAALDEARIAGFLEARNIASMFSINETATHPDIPWAKMNEQAKTVVHTTCQNVALAIDARIAELTAPPAEKDDLK